MWKKSKYNSSIETNLNPTQTAIVIDSFKRLQFLSLDIYGDVLLKRVQEENLERRIEKTETNFLSEIFGVRPGAIYMRDCQIVPQGYNPLKHGIYMDPKLLSGEQIIKIGFSSIYGRAKKLTSIDGFALNLLKIEKDKKRYFLRIYNINSYYVREKDKKLVERYRSRLISFFEENKDRC